MDSAFEEKIIPQTHVSLGAIEEGFSTKVYHAGTPKVDKTAESAKTGLRLTFLIIVTLVEITDKALQS